jgi:hypothetical protein
MNRIISGRSVAAGRPAAARLLLVATMLLAFAVQGFLVQTHIHQQGLFPADIAAKADHSSPRHDNYPANDDPASCPLCKELLYSGQYVAPMWAVFFLPTLAVSVIETALPAVSHSDTVSHSWSSRAPPRN